MKPYGRHSNVKGGNQWKIDYRIRIKNKKISNWWEAIKDPCKKQERRRAKNQIKKDLNESWFTSR